MKRKLYILTLAIVMAIAVVGYGVADINVTRDPGARVQVATFTQSLNAQSAAAYVTAGYNRALGVTIAGSSASAVGLLDTTSVANANAGTGEKVVVYCAAGTAQTLIFPLPLEITNTLYVLNTTTGGVVMLYYE